MNKNPIFTIKATLYIIFLATLVYLVCDDIKTWRGEKRVMLTGDQIIEREIERMKKLREFQQQQY